MASEDNTLMTSFDVIQIGYGPVSEGLALMLGRQGRRVAVCERWEKRYPLPRAVCIDHELYRVLSANGLGAVLPEISHAGPLYQWFNADWQSLLVIDWSAESISGGAEVNFVHQPTLEEALDRAASAQPGVELFLGWEAIAVSQTPDLAYVTLRNAASGEERQISARYVVGCDGANSLVRKTIGGTQEDRGFEADWLVIDVLLKDGVTIETLGIPAAGQYCNPARPTTIVPAGVREGRIFRRWEFMRLPGETIEELEREERMWELLSPWVGPDDVEVVRHKVYNFRSLMAERWRDGRLLIAGDAAHVMPPFMGQGMCSGLRDAWNLAWKLGLILDDKADGRLLDTYQTERAPHVSEIIDMSIYLGKIICIPDAVAAAARDQAFLGGTAPPPPPFPCLTDGLIQRTDVGAPAPGAGLLAPHDDIAGEGFSGRLDDYNGSGFTIVLRDAEPADLLDGHAQQRLAQIGTNFVNLQVQPGGHGVVDCHGRLDRFLAERRWAAMIVRPDYYAYGGVADLAALPELIDHFLDHLRRVGVRVDVPHHADSRRTGYEIGAL
jgi:2-polyprenyl-6-methoxyphenol hydroxylase-like FAD-dependent oxidoreductase